MRVCPRTDRSVYRRMAKMIRDTLRDGRERGAPLCLLGDGRIVMGREVVGDRCEVTIPACDAGVTVGLFHTHTSGMPIPSREDLEALLYSDLKVTCIGEPNSGGVWCYVPKGPREAEELRSMLESGDINTDEVLSRMWYTVFNPRDMRKFGFLKY